jgi:Fur family peroxide stress response transcriptional regulator
MADPQARLQQMLLKLKTRNFRLTPQRLAVLKILAASSIHPSVEDIYAEVRKTFPTTSLATIYKTIALLKEIHEVLEIRFTESSRFDGNKPYPHPHILCIQCGRVMDPVLPGVAELVAAAAEHSGYRIVDHRLNFFGICPDCQEDR